MMPVGFGAGDKGMGAGREDVCVPLEMRWNWGIGFGGEDREDKDFKLAFPLPQGTTSLPTISQITLWCGLVEHSPLKQAYLYFPIVFSCFA